MVAGDASTCEPYGSDATMIAVNCTSTNDGFGSRMSPFFMPLTDRLDGGARCF